MSGMRHAFPGEAGRVCDLCEGKGLYPFCQACGRSQRSDGKDPRDVEPGAEGRVGYFPNEDGSAPAPSSGGDFKRAKVSR